MKAKFEQTDDFNGYFFIMSKGVEKKVNARKTTGGKWLSYTPITDTDSKIVKCDNGLDVSFTKSNTVIRFGSSTHGGKPLYQMQKHIKSK